MSSDGSPRTATMAQILTGRGRKRGRQVERGRARAAVACRVPCRRHDMAHHNGGRRIELGRAVDDFAALKLSVDWFNAMCYDIFGSWSAYTGMTPPWWSPPRIRATGVSRRGSAISTTHGDPGAQLTLGLPFFGQRFQNTAGYTHRLAAPRR